MKVPEVAVLRDGLSNAVHEMTQGGPSLFPAIPLFFRRPTASAFPESINENPAGEGIKRSAERSYAQGDGISQRRIRRFSRRADMLNLSRRSVLSSAAAAAATLGLSKPLIFVGPAFGDQPIEPTVGHYKYKVGSIEVTAVYDGIWRKPHDPAFIKGVSVEETKAALAKAGLTTDFMPIPLTVVVLKIGDRLIMVDAGSGVGQWQANATNLPANMKAAGIDHNDISTVLISHFHPDHVWGLMEKGTNAPTFANAELVTNSVEYKFWTEPGSVDKLPEGRKAAGRRIAENFPKWKNWKLVESGAEVAPGVRILDAYGHTPGHSVFLVTSGKDQLMVSNDTMYVPGILAPHPDWQGAYDQDGPLAVETRRRIIDRVIADRMQICGAHFPFPGAGTFVKDGAAYAFTPVVQS
jgi:glyoxylase-like metal-dependent hydrolase (beta-lactamase superfamily II)